MMSWGRSSTLCLVAGLMIHQNMMSIRSLGVAMHVLEAVAFQEAVLSMTEPAAEDHLAKKKQSTISKNTFDNATAVGSVAKNLTLEERFAPYSPSLAAPLSDFDRKRLSKLPPTTHRLKVSTPIFVASLPKSGTSSMWKYFLCGGHMAAHTNSRVNESTAIRIGTCIEENIQVGKKPFESCGPYYIWSDAGYVTFPDTKSKIDPIGVDCFYPSLHALDALYQAYPDLTVVLMQRNATKWAHSVQSFQKIANRWTHCRRNNNNNTPSYMMMPVNDTVEDLVHFYHEHARRIREFQKLQAPSWTLVDLRLEGGSETGQLLEDALGVPATCWKHCNPSQRHCQDIKRH